MVNLQRTLRAHLLDLILRSCWANPQDFTSSIKRLYEAPFHIRNWDQALLAYCERASASAKQLNVAALCQQVRSLPCLVVLGRQDHLASATDCLELAGLLACPCLDLSCGHFAMEEDPVALVCVLTAFISLALTPQPAQ